MDKNCDLASRIKVGESFKSFVEFETCRRAYEKINEQLFTISDSHRLKDDIQNSTNLACIYERVKLTCKYGHD